MAGDWLKVELSLPEKPEVWQIAGTLGMDPDTVVGKLLKVWRWFDQHTENGNARGVTYALVDSSAGVTGFAEAMAFVGWLVQDGRDLRLPNFDRHNGKTGKNRALTAKRVAQHKGKSNAEGNGEVTPEALPREEKRREDIKATPIVPDGDMSAGAAEIVAAYHAILPNCQRVVAMTPKRQRVIRNAEKNAKRVCREQGWPYGADFWRDYFTECAKDAWMRGDVPNPKNANWKQSLDVLLDDDRFAKVMDSALGQRHEPV